MLTYKLNPDLKRITSPVSLLFPDGTKMQYANGAEVAEASFEKRYLVDTLQAEDGIVVIDLKEPEPMSLNWSGEEAVSFF